MPDDAGVTPRARVRARCAPVPAATGRTCPGELTALAAVVRELRAEHGLTVSSLARRAALDLRTVRRVERAQIRLRPSLLRSIAWALDPDEVDALYGRLVAAAVPAVRPDTPASLRVRGRRLNAGWSQATCRCPWRGSVRCACTLRRAPWGLSAKRCTAGLDVPQTAAGYEALRALLDALRAEENALFDRAPRTARERALAETGAAERAKLKAHPLEPVTRMRWLPDAPALPHTGCRQAGQEGA